MLLVLSVATGQFWAASARTINTNVQDRIRYAVGADVVLEQYWESNRLPLTGPPGMIEPATSDISVMAAEPLLYVEPPFWPYTRMEGVQAVTKVFRREAAARLLQASQAVPVALMGIVPHEFAAIAWFRRDLLPLHWHEYLNLLTRYPGAVLVSRSLAEKQDVRIGDSLSLTWAGQGLTSFTVLAVVDYWPTFDPGSAGEKDPPALVVANLATLQATMALEPYQVWIKKAAGSTSGGLYRALRESHVEIERLEDADQAVLAAMNEPALQGLNGSLTLGFLVTLLATLVGFVTFWAISLRERTLLFGVLRALGLSGRDVFAMVAMEIAVSTLFALLGGTAVGAAAIRLYVPLLQTLGTAQVPPFRVVTHGADYLRMATFVGASLVAGLLVLEFVVSRIRMHSALKLGED